ncbi:MAG: hypothetical protein OXH36_00670, partial [Bdellovibrionales bacterium]|nr:hypothetical protein [Bdellovibrionales bacterium]
GTPVGSDEGQIEGPTLNEGDNPLFTSFTLPTCSENDCCYKNTDCFSQCESLFPLGEDKKRCLKLPIEWVDKMQETVDSNLKDPKWDHLVYMELSVFWSILAISEKPWLDKISDYNNREARQVLYWLASQPDINEKVLSHLPGHRIRSLFLALFRKNTRSTLLDDNALLSSLKEPIEEDQNTFFEIADKVNNSLISIVHEQIVAKHLCDYSINHPRPVHYISDSRYQACVLAVYCYITGVYTEDSYMVTKENGRNGQVLRERLANEWEEDSKEITDFIEAPNDKGGLGIMDNADDFPDAACVKLKQLWDDGNLKFGLQQRERPSWWFPEFEDAYYWE